MTMPPGQPPYQQPPPYRWVPPEHPQGTTVLILGILSLAVCGLIGPFAWSMGHTALQEIDANPSAYSNRSYVLIGYICGIVGTCLTILGVVMLVVALAVALAAS
jgi:hypothetical protein